MSHNYKTPILLVKETEQKNGFWDSYLDTGGMMRVSIVEVELEYG